MVQKFSTSHEEPIVDLQFLYTKKYLSSDGQGAFYMILLMKQNSFEILDIAGKTLTSYPVEAKYVRIAGNPMNDEYYFIAQREDGTLDNYQFSHGFVRLLP